MYESNWFVSAAMGDTYDTAALHVRDALNRAGASGGETAAVMGGNARRVYGLQE